MPSSRPCPACPHSWSRPSPGTRAARWPATPRSASRPLWTSTSRTRTRRGNRGTNENTNGLLREYFPKGTEITDDQAYLDLVARELNNRPRRILGYRTPAEVFTDLLASSIASTG